MTEYSKLSDFYYFKEDALTEEFCQHCIKKFKLDPNKTQGKTGGGVTLDIKQSTDLNISKLSEWKEEDQTFFDSLTKSLNEYRDLHKRTLLWLNTDRYDDHGYQIQETLPGGFYKWHHDFFSTEKQSRFLTYLWYLNTVDEGGHTEFIDGTKVKPEIGKLILFPAAWPFYHQGTPPIKQTKYVCTGWIYLDSAFPNS